MISQTHREFWICFQDLPEKIQAQAKEKFCLWENDCFHPLLHFKPLLGDIWSARVNQNYRVLGRRRVW
ncbi:MAG: hypothetical protein M3Y82_12920, partial [Verrucomicrobiota bacterium]|nr:hypothetical protein [Verrucomicrobiota bacterium]